MRVFQSLLAAGAIVATGATAGLAATVLGPVSVSSTNQADILSLFGLENTIDQSGLSVGYTSGVTDFDAFTATATVSRNAFLSSLGGRRGLPGAVVFDYDLGDVFSVGGVGIFNQFGPAALQDFSLFASLSADFTGATLLGSFTAQQQELANVFSFDTLDARFLRLSATSNFGFAPGSVRINEFVVDGVPPGGGVSPIPVPAALPLLLGAIGGLGFLRRRRRPV